MIWDIFDTDPEIEKMPEPISDEEYYELQELRRLWEKEYDSYNNIDNNSVHKCR